MKKVMRSLIAASAVVAILTSPVSVCAAGISTNVTINVDNSQYELVIPAATTVTDYGWTELASNLKVTGAIPANKVVEVTVASDNDFRFVNAGTRKSIAYELRQTNDGTAVSKLTFAAGEVTPTGAPGKTLGVYVEKDAWNAVPGGSYTDVVTFTAALNNLSD